MSDPNPDCIRVEVTGPALVTTRRDGVETETAATAVVLVPIAVIVQAARKLTTEWPGLELAETVNAMILLVYGNPLRYVSEERRQYIVGTLRQDWRRAYGRSVGIRDPQRGEEPGQPREVATLNAPAVLSGDIDADSELIDTLSTTITERARERANGEAGGYQDGRSVDPAASALAGDMEDVITAAMGEMTADLRPVAMLAYHEGLNQLEIAGRRGLSPATVSRRMAAIRDALGDLRASILARRG